MVHNTQIAAKISHAIELYAQSLLLTHIGDDKAADKLKQAQDLIKEQQNIDIVLPSAIAPPKEAAPAGGPTTAPPPRHPTGAAGGAAGTRGGESPTTAPSTRPVRTVSVSQLPIARFACLCTSPPDPLQCALVDEQIALTISDPPGSD